VLAIAPADLPRFEAICARERCPFAVVGVATDERQLQLVDAEATGADEFPVDMPMEVLLGKPPRMHRDVARVATERAPVDVTGISLAQVALDVLRIRRSAASRS
jgi:phosphoribosylformylglycinamidine synthase